MNRIGHMAAVAIIIEHGWMPNQSTAVDENGNWIQGTSFYDELGRKPSYTIKEIMDWLGY